MSQSVLPRIETAYNRAMDRLGVDCTFLPGHSVGVYDPTTGEVTQEPIAEVPVVMILTRQSKTTSDGFAVHRTRRAIIQSPENVVLLPAPGDAVLVQGVHWHIVGVPKYHYISGRLVGYSVNLAAGAG